MAKLIKLTSKEGIVNNGNSFKCQSDEDIYIDPMSTVSLLNAHISSGILSSYNVDGSERVGQDTGLHVASLYLTPDKSDRERKIICTNGDYDITQMNLELTNASNKSLLYNSTPTPLSSTTDVFTTPANSDFGLQMLVNLDANSKVSINFNSSQQIASNLTFSNKNDGVNIDPATGNITYANPVGQVAVDLQAALANDITNTITTVQNASTAGFAVGDSCNLVDANSGNTKTVSITNIVQSASSLATARAITTQTADTITIDDPITGDLPAEYVIGADVTLDDGTSTTNANLSNVAHGKIAAASAIYNNNNTAIYEINDFRGLRPTIFNIIAKSFIDPNDPTQGINLTIDAPFADAADLGFEAGRYLSIWTQADGNGSPHAAIEIAVVADDNGNTNILSTAELPTTFTGKGFAFNQCQSVVSFDVIKTNIGGGYDIQYIPTVDGAPISGTGTFNDTSISCLLGATSLFQNVIEDITNDATTVAPAFTNIIKFQPQGLLCLDNAGGNVLTDMDAFVQFVSVYSNIGDPAQLTQISTIIIDKVQSKDDDIAGLIGPINDQDIVVIDALDSAGGVIYGNLQVIAQPFDFQINATDTRVIIPITVTGLGAIDEYKYYDTLFRQLRDDRQGQQAGPFLVVNDATKFIELQLNNLDVPDLTAMTVQPIRMWFGIDIYTTTSITLNIGALAQSLTDFNKLIKGTINKDAIGSFAMQDTRLSKSCGRIVYKVITAGPCEMGIIQETPDFLNLNVSDNYVKVKIQNAAGAGGAGFVYTLWRGNTRIPLKRDLQALDGDRVCIQWGVCPSISDFEYNDTVNGGTNSGAINAGSYFASAGEIVDDDRQKMLFSVSRAGNTNSYFYLGATNFQGDAAKVIPWTPRATPYLEPIYYDNTGNYRVYVCPNQATVRLIEITKDPTLVTVNGVLKYIDGDTEIYNDDLHGQDHPDLIDQSHRLTSFANYWYWVWTDLYFQKQLGFNAPSQSINASKGSFTATKDYLTAYLPENLVVFLDNVPSESYDLDKTKGLRRNIIGTCINTQGKVGEINVEPANLYRISLNNKQPMNLRKFFVSFETFYGEQIKLMSAKAVVNLLIEPPQ
jgi:hypothetical protein